MMDAVVDLDPLVALLDGHVRLARRAGAPFYEQDGIALGPEDLAGAVCELPDGRRPPLATGFQVAERAGCDLNPGMRHPKTAGLTLLACIFPDEHERFDLLERAIAVARETPAPDDARWRCSRSRVQRTTRR